MAIRILSIPTSSAASERNWSAFVYIHDKKRNRLIADHVLKLVYIYSNYKLQMPKEITEWKGSLDELNKVILKDKNNADNVDNVDDANDEIQVENEESDYEDEYLSSSDSEIESESDGENESEQNESENDNETDTTD